MAVEPFLTNNLKKKKKHLYEIKFFIEDEKIKKMCVEELSCIPAFLIG